MARFTLWEGPISGVSLETGDGPPMIGDVIEDPDARMVLAFEADSWNQACQVQHDYYGWGRYEPPAVPALGTA